MDNVDISDTSTTDSADAVQPIPVQAGTPVQADTPGQPKKEIPEWMLDRPPEFAPEEGQSGEGAPEQVDIEGKKLEEVETMEEMDALEAAVKEEIRMLVEKYPESGRIVGNKKRRMFILNSPLEEKISIGKTGDGMEIERTAITYVIATLVGYRGVMFVPSEESKDFKLMGPSRNIENFEKLSTRWNNALKSGEDVFMDVASGFSVGRTGKETITLQDPKGLVATGNIDLFSLQAGGSGYPRIIKPTDEQVLEAKKMSKAEETLPDREELKRAHAQLENVGEASLNK